MLQTGTVTMPATLGEGDRRVPRLRDGRHSMTLPRPGEQRKGACPAATVSTATHGFKASRSHPFDTPGGQSLSAVRPATGAHAPLAPNRIFKGESFAVLPIKPRESLTSRRFKTDTKRHRNQE